ncbi:reverse transcriptase domain-containing protein [Tanacetum coccineum]
MEEMLYKFIDEGKREQEEMRAFIHEFRTTNELLFKERDNSLSELRFEVQGLLRVINNTPISNMEVKGVTTRCGKTTTQDVQDNDTNIHTKEPLVINHDEPVESNEVLTKVQSQKTNEPLVRPTSEVQTPPIPFPRRLRKEKEEAQQKIFLENLKQLHINLPFIEAIAQMPKYAKFWKLPSKEKDTGSFTIPCDIGQLHINNALADLKASISLIPYTMYEKLGLGEPKATRMSLKLANRSIQYPRGIVENVLIKDDKFVLSIDFVILDMPEDSRVPIILGRPFLATARAMIDVFNKKITLRVGDDERPRNCWPTILVDDSDSGEPIRRIESVNTPYPAAQKTAEPNKVESEQLYSASANKIDEKKPELKILPQHLIRPPPSTNAPVVYTDHSALKYLFSKQDAKPKLIRWVLLLQGFGIEIKDKKGIENLAADHLWRLENPDLRTFTEEKIVDKFPDEHLTILKTKLNEDELWGHHSASITGRKVYESGFFWPNIFKDAKDYVMRCDACQRSRNISSRSEIPQNNIQIEHKAYWALKQCNMDLTTTTKNRFMELNELIELRDGAYENTRIYKERTKRWHDSRLRGDKNFKVGDKVLLFNSRFKMHLGKLKSRWYGPNVVKIMYPYGTIEIIDRFRINFKVNEQRLKKYHDEHTDAKDKEVVEFEQDTTF